jgi:hypothetical protein
MLTLRTFVGRHANTKNAILVDPVGILQVDRDIKAAQDLGV